MRKASEMNNFLSSSLRIQSRASNGSQISKSLIVPICRVTNNPERGGSHSQRPKQTDRQRPGCTEVTVTMRTANNSGDSGEGIKSDPHAPALVP